MSAGAKVFGAVAVILGAGASSSLLVAWACMPVVATPKGLAPWVRLDTPTEIWQVRRGSTPGRVTQWLLRVRHPAMTGSPPGRPPRLAWCHLDLPAPSYAAGESDFTRQCFDGWGWPFAVLWKVEGELERRTSVTIAGHAFPTRIAGWPLLADTAVYAGIWSVLLLWRPAVRSVRRRRGLCVRCAYPIGNAPRCSECGRPPATHGPGA